MVADERRHPSNMRTLLMSVPAPPRPQISPRKFCQKIREHLPSLREVNLGPVGLALPGQRLRMPGFALKFGASKFVGGPGNFDRRDKTPWGSQLIPPTANDAEPRVRSWCTSPRGLNPVTGLPGGGLGNYTSSPPAWRGSTDQNRRHPPSLAGGLLRDDSRPSVTPPGGI